MNITQWLQIGAACALFICYLAFTNWRHIKSYMADWSTVSVGDEPQAGVAMSADGTVPSTTRQPPTTDRTMWQRTKGYVWLPVIIGVAFLVWWQWERTSDLSVPKPSLGAVWGWTKDYWFWVVLGISVCIACPAFVTSDDKKFVAIAGALRSIGIVLFPTLFIVLPVVNAIWGSDSSSPQRQQQAAMKSIPLTSMPKERWPKLVMPADKGGASPAVHVPPGYHIVTEGYDFLLYNVYQDGTKCEAGNKCPPGVRVKAYAENTSDMAHAVIYAFAPN